MFEDEAVLAGGRLAFVSVDEDVFGFVGLLGDEGPLHAGGEARAAASTQVRGLHLGDDGVRGHFEGLARSRVAVELDVFVDVGRALAEA